MRTRRRRWGNDNDNGAVYNDDGDVDGQARAHVCCKKKTIRFTCFEDQFQWKRGDNFNMYGNINDDRTQDRNGTGDCRYERDRVRQSMQNNRHSNENEKSKDKERERLKAPTLSRNTRGRGVPLRVRKPLGDISRASQVNADEVDNNDNNGKEWDNSCEEVYGDSHVHMNAHDDDSDVSD